MEEITSYKHIQVKGFKGKPSTDEITRLEELLEAPLPSSYINFLNHINGGQVIEEYEIMYGRFDWWHVRSFYTFGHTDEWYNIFSRLLAHQQKENAPKHLLPIGINNGREQAYLDLSKEGNGRIIEDDDYSKLYGGRYTEICADFDTLIDNLKAHEDRLTIPAAKALDKWFNENTHLQQAELISNVVDKNKAEIVVKTHLGTFKITGIDVIEWSEVNSGTIGGAGVNEWKDFIWIDGELDVPNMEFRFEAKDFKIDFIE